jgi:hypothetical protein
MRKTNLVLKTAVAAALGLTAMSAIAGTVASSPATYATEGIPASGAVTIPLGITYTTSAATDTGSSSGLLTIKLPTGVTFVSVPSLTADGTIVSAPTVANSPLGSNSLVISYTRTADAGGTLTLGAFQVTGATALANTTGAGAFQFTAQSSGFADNSRNDSSVSKADLALSAKQLIVELDPAALFIDVPPPSNATRWKASGKSVATSGYVGTLVVNNGNYVNAENTDTFKFTSSTANATIIGNFAGVKSAYLAPDNASCASTAPGTATTGTVTNSSIIFAGITPAATARSVCLGATGTAILQPTVSGLPTSAIQDTFTTTPTNPSNLGAIDYNGNVAYIDYVVGATGGYSNYLRVVNNDSVSSDVRVVVQSDSGTINSGLLGTLAPNTSQLYSVDQINTATGSKLQTANDRASLTVLTPTKSTNVSNLLVNPNGTLVNIK